MTTALVISDLHGEDDKRIIKEEDFNKCDFIISVGDITDSKLRDGTPAYRQNMNFGKPLIGVCLSEDSEILSIEGWKSYSDLHEGMSILTFDMNKNILEYQPIRRVIKYHYNGKMINIQTNHTKQNQLLTPDHQVIYKKYGKQEWYVKNAKDIYREPYLRLPIAAKFIGTKLAVSDDFLRICAWVITEGSIDKEKYGKYRRLFIYQKADKSKQITDILDRLSYKYSIYENNKQQRLSPHWEAT